MVKHFKVTIFGDCLPVYDGKKSLYTASPLPVASGGVSSPVKIDLLLKFVFWCPDQRNFCLCRGKKIKSSEWKSLRNKTFFWSTVYKASSHKLHSVKALKPLYLFYRSTWMSPCQETVGRTAHLRSQSGSCHWSAGTCCTKFWPAASCLSRLTWRNQSAPTPCTPWTLFFAICPPWSRFYIMVVHRYVPLMVQGWKMRRLCKPLYLLSIVGHIYACLSVVHSWNTTMTFPLINGIKENKRRKK